VTVPRQLVLLLLAACLCPAADPLRVLVVGNIYTNREQEWPKAAQALLKASGREVAILPVIGLYDHYHPADPDRGGESDEGLRFVRGQSEDGNAKLKNSAYQDLLPLFVRRPPEVLVLLVQVTDRFLGISAKSGSAGEAAALDRLGRHLAVYGQAAAESQVGRVIALTLPTEVVPGPTAEVYARRCAAVLKHLPRAEVVDGGRAWLAVRGRDQTRAEIFPTGMGWGHFKGFVAGTLSFTLARTLHGKPLPASGLDLLNTQVCLRQHPHNPDPLALTAEDWAAMEAALTTAEQR
jgi:hypothetical protein